jgi:hypothetical protein
VYDQVIDVKEAAELFDHTNELERMDIEDYYIEAQPHIDGLRRSIERQQATPEVKRAIGKGALTREMLDTMER